MCHFIYGAFITVADAEADANDDVKVRLPIQVGIFW